MTQQAPHRLAGVASAAAAVVVWGGSSVLIKEVHGVSGIAIAFHRLWIGALLTSLLFLATGGRFTRRLLRLSLPGGVAFALDILLFFTAVQHTSVAAATIIGALQPVLVLALAPRLFGERPRLGDGLWGVVAIAGAAAVVLAGEATGGSDGFGNLLATAALVAWTWYFVASKRAREELGSFEYLAGLSVVALVVTAPFAIASGQRLSVPEAKGWVIIVIIACVNGALGHFLMNWAHAHVPLMVISLMTLGIPVVAAAAAAVFIDEPLTGLQLAGMAVVIGALAMIVLRTARLAPTVAEVAAA